jgi:enoyl-CoA hydratase/carnithine racemase
MRARQDPGLQTADAGQVEQMLDESVRVDMPAPHVALVTLNRPEARNAVNAAMTRALELCRARCEADAGIWVVILTGAGEDAFCAGADLKEVAAGRMAALATQDGGFAGFVRGRRSKPWIAAVNGAAVAGGLEIALACDMIVASAAARFGLPEVSRGLMALAGGLVRLPRAIPRCRALELIATGRAIGAGEALALGLVNKVVENHLLIEAALALAADIVANAPVAVRESMSIARRALDLPEAELEALTSEAGRAIAATEDFHEGPRAFIEKRPPEWTGR